MLNKKITKIIIGTNNAGKLREIRALLPKNIKIFSPSDFKLKSPIENGKSFAENSLIKAKFFSEKSKMISLADDSGLEIDILDKAPGIFSARWAGKKNNFNIAIRKIFRELYKKDKKWKKNKIKARFVCALTIYGNKKIIKSSIGIINGYISNKPLGENGFGYDPIFIPKNKKMTFSQLKPSDKYKIDHRFKAFKKIKKFL